MEENERMELYSVKEVAKMLSVSEFAVRLWLREGRIKGIKIGAGRLWRIPADEIRAIAQNG